MNFASHTAHAAWCCTRWFAGSLGCLLLLLGSRFPAAATETNAVAGPVTINLATPAVMTGTFYQIGSQRKIVLFKYRRAATREGDLTRVEQTFTQPDGTIDCREDIRYQNDQLASYTMEDFRANIRGSIVIEANPKKRGNERILLTYIEGRKDKAKVKKAAENLEPNTLISDTVYPHILACWDDLTNGETLKFRFISLDPARTFAFRLSQESETNWQGHAAIRVKMEAANFIVAHWINPIYFIVEKAPPHRIFSYIGRATPRALIDGNWKPIDAEAVFDWP